MSTNNCWIFEGGELLSPLRAFHRFPSIAEISCFKSVQLSLAQTEQSALNCLFTFFFAFLQAPLRRCGLIVSSLVHCFSRGGRFAKAPFGVSRLDSKGAKEFSTSIHLHDLIFNFGSFLPKDACKSDRSRQCPFFSISFSNQIAIPTSIWLRDSIQPRTSPLKLSEGT